MRKPTIYEALKAKIEREPTHKEIKEEVRRILGEALIERTEKKKRGKNA